MNKDDKAIVVYFSAQNHTKNVATKIAANVDADIFEIEPVQAYTEDDLSWTDSESRVGYATAAPPFKLKINLRWVGRPDGVDRGDDPLSDVRRADGRLADAPGPGLRGDRADPGNDSSC